MPRVVRETLLSVRDLMETVGPFVLIAIVLLIAAYWLLDPTPPKRVVLATGPERSAYAEFGKRYQVELAKFGIQVELKQTAGSRENLRILHDPKKREADFGFIQGGSAEAAARLDQKEGETALYSLGSLFIEPYWLFYRVEAAKRVSKDGVLTRLPDMRGWKVNVGGRGSGAPGLSTRLMTANLMEREDIQRTNVDDITAVPQLLSGQLDAMVMVSAPEAQYVQMLLQTPGIRLFEFPNATAYARRYSYLTPVTLPRGVADISRDAPPADVPLLATTTSLVAREGTHPALIQLFVQAASRTHSGAGWIAEAGRFPTGQKSEFPLAKDAERFYRTGPPLMQRYLPFWLANLIDRMWVVLVSIVAILIPLSRIVPPLYQFRVRSRIFRWYRQLRRIEDDNEKKNRDSKELLEELEQLDANASRIIVPLAYTDELYALRQHIDLVRERVASYTGKIAA
jgi:TRAP-type uncharacterized transport system substrate-binding protein